MSKRLVRRTCICDQLTGMCCATHREMAQIIASGGYASLVDRPERTVRSLPTLDELRQMRGTQP